MDESFLHYYETEGKIDGDLDEGTGTPKSPTRRVKIPRTTLVMPVREWSNINTVGGVNAILPSLVQPRQTTPGPSLTAAPNSHMRRNASQTRGNRSCIYHPAQPTACPLPRICHMPQRQTNALAERIHPTRPTRNKDAVSTLHDIGGPARPRRKTSGAYTTPREIETRYATAII